ncbi:MAG: lactate utilization protein [Oscillospiraceae bacterium]|nr:lactate utilization protein [Oscillospiraceae bacterium]MBR2890702.1 lactate utilization protein [Oscillospiraceae bacterium]
MFYDKRGSTLVKNLISHHFDAWYCATKEEALAKALQLIPEGSTVGWGGAMSAQQIGLIDAVDSGNFNALNRDKTTTPQERTAVMRACFNADWFITGANALSLDGQMVNIDGVGNRTGMIIYGPTNILVIAGMNKVVDSLEEAVRRTRTIAAPQNAQRFGLPNPCSVTGACGDCKNETCICNQLLITRNSKPAGRIKMIIVGQDLGF